MPQLSCGMVEAAEAVAEAVAEGEGAAAVVERGTLWWGGGPPSLRSRPLGLRASSLAPTFTSGAPQRTQCPRLRCFPQAWPPH